MSSVESVNHLTIEQLKEEIEKEYLTSIQLINTIVTELEQIKHATSPGSEFEGIVLKNSELLQKLVQMKQLKMTDLFDSNEKRNSNSLPHTSKAGPGTSAS